MSNSRVFVITGASSGIGFQLCKDLIEGGDRVYGSVRKREDAIRVKKEVPGLELLEFDVTDTLAVRKAAEFVDQRESAGMDFLINNAGIVVSGPLLHVPIEQIDHQFQVNVIGVLNTIQAFAPLLGAQKKFNGMPGKIIQISSVSGKIGMPFVGPYAASKFALEGLSESLRRELLLYGIDVIVIGPGAVKTPIWTKRPDEYTRFENTDYGSIISNFRDKLITPIMNKAIPVEKLSQDIIKITRKSNPKTRYTFTNNWFSGYLLPLMLPSRMVDKAIKKQLGL